jgi:hypothetical protein
METGSEEEPPAELSSERPLELNRILALDRPLKNSSALAEAMIQGS